MATTYEYDDNGELSNIVRDLTEYDAGEFKVGDRVRFTPEAIEARVIGATGTVVRVDDKDDHDGDPIIYPIVVQVDGIKTPLGVMGLPVCAREVEKVSK